MLCSKWASSSLQLEGIFKLKIRLQTANSYFLMNAYVQSKFLDFQFLRFVLYLASVVSRMMIQPQ